MINLVSVIGHGTNLLPHFIDHYYHQVDRIFLVVYESDLFPDLKLEISKKIEGYEKVEIAKTVYDRVFDWERVTDLYNNIKFQKPDDWWVIADIDEFHLYSKPINEIIDSCEKMGWEIVRGGFIDRIGKNGMFNEIKENENIFSQFPMAGFFRYPLSGACPNKICITRGSIKITSGQHYAEILNQTTWRWQGWNHPLIAPIEEYSVQVHHFKWDKTCLERIKKVSEVSQKYAYSHEYKLMYDSIKENKIDLKNPLFMFEKCGNHFNDYKKWNNLIRKIISI